MLFNYISKFSKKVIVLTISIYLVSTLFIISRAENYEWSIINNSDAIETNSQAEGTRNEAIAKDELNLDCESAILIEQNSRPSAIRKKRSRTITPSKCNKTNEHTANIRGPRKPVK